MPQAGSYKMEEIIALYSFDDPYIAPLGISVLTVRGPTDGRLGCAREYRAQ